MGCLLDIGWLLVGCRLLVGCQSVVAWMMDVCWVSIVSSVEISVSYMPLARLGDNAFDALSALRFARVVACCLLSVVCGEVVDFWHLVDCCLQTFPLKPFGYSTLRARWSSLVVLNLCEESGPRLEA